jgi:hypothetical protein
MEGFVSEDDAKTFEGWMKYQCLDLAALTWPEQEVWRRHFDESMKRCAANPRVGLMKLQPIAGEYRYAVAVQERGDLWLVLWVRRTTKGEFFVMVPRGERDWDPHTSYHLDGTIHSKSYGRKVVHRKGQPLRGDFKGIERLGVHLGYSPKGVGAICDPAAYSGVITVDPGILGPCHGRVAVDLVGPECPPPEVRQQVFGDFVPSVVITVGS